MMILGSSCDITMPMHRRFIVYPPTLYGVNDLMKDEPYMPFYI